MFPGEVQRPQGRIKRVVVGAFIGLALIGATRCVGSEDAQTRDDGLFEAWIPLPEGRVQVIGKTVCSLRTDAQINTVLQSMVGSTELSNIQRLKSYYKAAERHTGIPWQLFAAIHFRESGASESRDLQAGNPYGGPYEYVSDSYNKYGHPDGIVESLNMMAKEFEGKNSTGRSVRLPNPSQYAIQDALFGYNGRNGDYTTNGEKRGFRAPFDGSPYVMNLFDEKRGFLSPRSTLPIVTEDNGEIDGLDRRPGAYTVYTLLRGPGSCLDNSEGAVV